MPGILRDTHTLYWLVSGTRTLTDDALVAIGENQAAGMLYVSSITAWELSIAAQEPLHRDPPRLDATISKWFRAAVRATSSRVLPIGRRIAIEAAEVPYQTGHKDPGDCFLIATARLRKCPIVTRDSAICRVAAGNPGYLDIVVC